MEAKRFDLISRLPNEILHHVVSCLPLKEAVRTCSLSSSWKCLWAPFQVNLNFKLSEVSGEELEAEVKKILHTFLRHYDSHGICKCYSRSENGQKKFLEANGDLFFLAVKGVEKELHLNFSEVEEITSEFNLKLEVPPNAGFHNHSCFSSLKSLHLRSITHLTENLVSSLFTNCLVLESLMLENCSGLQSIDIKANDCLQSITVMDCPEMVSIILSAPSLKKFSYKGVILQIQLRNTVSLFDVLLDFEHVSSNYEFECEEILTLLASLKEVEMLSLSGWLLEWLCLAGVIFEWLEFQFSKLKVLHWTDSSMDKHKRDSLACFLNITPVLENLLIRASLKPFSTQASLNSNAKFINQSRISVSPPYINTFWHEPHLWVDYCSVRSNASRLENLRVVKLVGLANDEIQLQLMDLLLKKAIMLESITLTSLEKHSWRIFKVPQSQKKHSSKIYSRPMAFPPADGSLLCFTEDSCCHLQQGNSF
ncbi:F-box domain [Dillenia turbinata]|uniref:F-box domain n=1 Tax=Dillenia turbinata TaxID=194707 RepID=A0AAN8ZMW2_9MAGN